MEKELNISHSPMKRKVRNAGELTGKANTEAERDDDFPVTPARGVVAKRTVEDFLCGQLSEETKKAYRTDLKTFLRFLGSPMKYRTPEGFLQTMADVDRQKAAAYRDYLLHKGYAAATVYRKLSVVSNVIQVLVDDRILPRNPFSLVKRPKVSNDGKTPGFTKEQAELLITLPDQRTKMGRRDRALLMLMFFCGLRRAEVAKVRIEDFYQDSGYVCLRILGKGKSTKQDIVKVPVIVWDAVKKHMPNTKEGLLFTGQSRNRSYNHKDKPLSPKRINLIVKKYCAMANIDPANFSAHSTRVTCITLALDGGATIRSTMQMARHKSPSTTIRYDRSRQNLSNHASDHIHLDLPDMATG